MAVIAAGNRYFFLAQAGACPWSSEDPATTRVSDRTGVAVIRWHSHASHIPLPPGPADDRQEVIWAHLPSRGLRLACPALLLHLLAAATAALQHGPGVLTLPGAVLAIPAFGSGTSSSGGPPASAGLRPTSMHPWPAIPFGFRSSP
jgi:hypothetical protein